MAKPKDLYTQLNSSDRPESIVRESEIAQQQPSQQYQGSTAGPKTPSSISKVTGFPTDLKTRSRRYKHRRSKSHENYAKIMSPRHSPHVERVSF